MYESPRFFVYIKKHIISNAPRFGLDLAQQHRAMKKLYCGLGLLVTVLLASCSLSSEKEVKYNYLPFQAEEDGKWGMISLDGKVLFKAEFKNMPSTPYYDRFMVYNKDSLLEYYTVEAKPRLIGKEYQQGTDFSKCGLAVVARPGKTIEAIDREGNVVLTLSTFEGHKVVAASSFNDVGLAMVVTEEGFYGCINSEGKTVLKPNYCSIGIGNDGYIVGIEMKNASDWYKNHSSVKRIIFNEKGEQITELAANKYEGILDSDEGYFRVSVVEGKDTIMGIMNPNGEWVVKPAKNVRSINDIHNGYFTYYDGESVGLKDFEGNQVIRPKYKQICFTANNNRLVAFDGDDVDNLRRKILDYEGNQIGSDTYKGCFYEPFDDYTIVHVSKNNYTSIDKDGNEQKNVPELYNVDVMPVYNVVRNQEVDIEELVRRLKITEEGLDQMTVGMSVSDVHQHAISTSDSIMTNIRNIGTPEEYHKNNPTWYSIEYGRFIENTVVNIRTWFQQPITKLENNKPVFNNGKSFILQAFIPTKLAYLKSIETDIYKALRQKFEKFGSVTQENENACIIKGKSHTYCVFLNKQNHYVGFGYDVPNVNIGDFK